MWLPLRHLSQWPKICSDSGLGLFWIGCILCWYVVWTYSCLYAKEICESLGLMVVRWFLDSPFRRFMSKMYLYWIFAISVHWLGMICNVMVSRNANYKVSIANVHALLIWMMSFWFPGWIRRALFCSGASKAALFFFFFFLGIFICLVEWWHHMLDWTPELGNRIHVSLGWNLTFVLPSTVRQNKLP